MRGGLVWQQRSSGPRNWNSCIVGLQLQASGGAVAETQSFANLGFLLALRAMQRGKLVVFGFTVAPITGAKTPRGLRGCTEQKSQGQGLVAAVFDREGLVNAAVAKFVASCLCHGPQIFEAVKGHEEASVDLSTVL